MNLSDVVDVAASGLVAQRARLAVTASNLANSHATRTPEGGPYQRRDPVFRAEPVAGPFGGALERAVQRVDVSRVAVDPRGPVPRFAPGHPDADEEGYVNFPRVNPVEEMTNMLSASRAFETNLLTIRKVRQMAQALNEIGR